MINDFGSMCTSPVWLLVYSFYMKQFWVLIRKERVKGIRKSFVPHSIVNCLYCLTKRCAASDLFIRSFFFQRFVSKFWVFTISIFDRCMQSTNVQMKSKAWLKIASHLCEQRSAWESESLILSLFIHNS